MPIKPDEIAADMPLFGEGLGLDSIDALEIVLELQRSFGVVVSDEQMGQRVLRSVRTIVEFIDSTRVPSAGG
jgi:acyl carrier protein